MTQKKLQKWYVINPIPKIQDIYERYLHTPEAVMKDIYGRP